MIQKAARWSFLILIASLPFPRPFSFFISGIRVPYTDIIFLIAAALAVAALLSGELRPRFDRAFLLVGLYGGALTITAGFPEASFLKLFGEYYLFALCFLTFLHCDDPQFVRRMIIAWIVATALTALLSLLGFLLFYAGLKNEGTNYFLSHLGSLPAGNYPRVQSLFANPNMLCNYLNISIPLIWFAGKSGWISRWACRMLLGLAIIAAVLSLSPGLGGIALSMGLVGYFCLGTNTSRRRSMLAAGILVAFGIFAVTLISPNTSNTQQEIPFSGGSLEPSVRVLVWENVIERVSGSPLLGSGIGSMPARMEYTPLTGERQLLTDAHNMYLNVLGQSGVVGLVCFILLLVYLFKRCRWTPRSREDLLLPVLSCAFVGTFLYQGLTGSFEEARHVWVLLGMLIAASRTPLRSDISPASKEL